MRVNKHLHEVAGAVLYHTVRVDEHNLAGFFLGGLVGVASEHMACAGKGDMCFRFTEEEKALHRLPRTVPTPDRTDNDQTSNNDVGVIPTNFKAPLLAHVRFLSLGSHHTCVCHTYDKHVSTLLANLDTLRIVPLPESDVQLKPLCGDPEACLLFKHLKPRKLALRNLDDMSFHVNSWPKDLWGEDHLNELVWFIPTDFAVYCSAGMMGMADYFITAKRVKFIFSHEWEVWRQPVRWDVARRWAIPPHRFVAVVNSWTVYTGKEYTMYGLETVGFTSDALVEEFRRRFPDVPLRGDRLRKLVEDEIRTGDLQSAIGIWEYYDHHSPTDIAFKTMEEYAALPEIERQHEIDDGL